MFKVFKSKETINNNQNENKSNRDILEDFNNYQKNTFEQNSMMQNPNINNINGIDGVNPNNTFQVNNNQVGTNNMNPNNIFNQNINQITPNQNEIDLNKNIEEAQNLRKQHEQSYQNMVNEANDVEINNTKDNLDYVYNEQIKKRNTLDNIKSLIDDNNDENVDQNITGAIPINQENTFIPNQTINQGFIPNQAFIGQQNSYMQYPNMNNIQSNQMYNGQNMGYTQNLQYPNMPYGNNQMGYNPNPQQFSRSDIMVYNVPVQNYPGQNQTVSESVQPQPSNQKLLNPNMFEEVEPGFKRCPRCGQKLRDDYKQCFVCGTWLG